MGRDTAKGSRTALGNLAMACIAASERDPALRNDDPIAPRLLSWRDGGVATARLKLAHPAIRFAAEHFIPGIYGYALARVKHMDLIVSQEVLAGIDSLIILGAGYDTRAYRMHEELTDIQVIEVDHRATSRDKRRRLASALVPIPANVSFLEVDFTHQDLLEQLVRHGHESDGRTLFLLSGVSMYLPENSMLGLFDQVASHAAPRTSLLFDYIDANVLTDPERYYGSEWLPYARRVGEEPRWGIPTGEAQTLLATRGLRLASDVNAEELTDRYLRRGDGSTVARPFDFGAVAHAFVEATPDRLG
jgi:methyltransferase (TIGR00027 family)